MADNDAVQQHDADQSPEDDKLEQDGFDMGADGGTNDDGSLKIPDIDKPEKKAEKTEKKPEKNVDKTEEKAEEKSDEPEEKASDGEQKEETAYQRAERMAKELDEKVEDKTESVIDKLPERYAKLAKDEKLQDWLEKQSKSVQKLAQSSDVDDAVYVLDMYEKASQPTQEEKKAIKSLVSQFGDRKFVAPDGKERTIKEMVAEYGNDELMEAAAVLAEAIAESREASRPKEKNESAEKVDALQQRLEEVVQRQAFWENILEAHPDGKGLVKSGKVGEWVKSQPEFMQRLYSSPVAEHGIRVLDAYKEYAARDAGVESDAKAKDKKSKLDGLHGESLSTKRSVKASSSKNDADEFDDGFEKGSK